MKYRFMRFPDGKTKAVTLSYDDGTKGDLRLAEICNEHGIKCTFNLVSSFLERSGPNHLTVDEVKSNLLDCGHEVAVHTSMHAAPGSVSEIDGISGVLDCRRYLETAFNRIIRGMAYPDSGIGRLQNGVPYDNIKNYLQYLGIAYARTLGGDNNSFLMPQDWYSWRPTCHHNNPQLFDWTTQFVEIDVNKGYYDSRYPRLFYLWGHSHEFISKDNWNVLEHFCEIVSGHDDIWYATNIEIYDYTMAYRRLQFSANNTLVYNPTAVTLWFDIDGKLFSVKPNETVELS